MWRPTYRGLEVVINIRTAEASSTGKEDPPPQVLFFFILMPISVLVSSLILLHTSSTCNQHVPRSAHKAHTRNPRYIYCTLYIHVYCIGRQQKMLTNPTILQLLFYNRWLHTRKGSLFQARPNTDDWRKSLVLCLLCDFRPWL